MESTPTEVVMAALVVVTVPPANEEIGDARIGIFPGGAIPTMYPAEAPFWVGYGFAADSASDARLDDAGTRFELDVDGEAVAMLSEVDADAGLPARKTDVARFPNGLPAGWHDFSGRWYEAGRLILSSRAAIQFVEP
jgi:hypothetical protein